MLIADEKKEYARALVRYFMEAYRNHTTISSKAARTRTNPLFSSDYSERELRKDQANHRRETECFSRNVANMMNRLTHGEVPGISKEAIAYKRALLFRVRAFLSRAYIPALASRLWMRAFRTPLKKKADYLPKYAVG